MFRTYHNDRLYFHPNPLIRYGERKRISLIINALNPFPDDTILSVGCGEGYLARQITKAKVVGIDLSEEAIRRAKVKNAGSKHVFLTADAHALPFETNTFSKAECSEVLEHLFDPRLALNELLRVTKADAALVFSIPNEPLIEKIKTLTWSLRLEKLLLPEVPRHQEWHLHDLNLAEFRKLVEPVLTITQVSAIPFSWLPARYCIVCKKKNPASLQT